MVARFLTWLCTLLAVAAAGQEGDVVAARAFEADEECPAGFPPESCSLSLRQLRARGVVPAVAPHAQAPAAEAAPAPEEPEAPADNGTEHDMLKDGVPGGWGEAADFADQVVEDSTRLVAAHGWGSCAMYGCVSYYSRFHGCQCNPSCASHGSCCGDYWSRCHHHNHHHHHSQPHPALAPHPGGGSHRVLTLFHQTSPSACNMILRSNFHPGSQGWCGGGIYFATSAQATRTKAIGPDSHQGCILQAQVDVGRSWHLSPTCNRGLRGSEVSSHGYDSVTFDPGDGTEYVVYSSSRVLSIRRFR
mmetsp:Transcript_58688/g.181982  ORF Transcript_58688/g.181982 Transcript_58688/m.181982 type:complete len:303 (+) Transcript_58688:87-995(+)